MSVQLDGLGLMTGLWMGESAYRIGPDALAQLIVGTARAAAQVALDRETFLLEEFNEWLRALQQAPLTRYGASTFQPGPPGDE